MKKRSRQLAVLGIIGLHAVQGGSIETKAAKQLAPSSVKAPTLTITEILPDSSNVEGAVHMNLWKSVTMQTKVLI